MTDSPSSDEVAGQATATVPSIPKDINGITTPHDDEKLSPDCTIVRGVTKHHVVNSRSGGKRLSSGLLDPTSKRLDPYEGVSIDIPSRSADMTAHPKELMGRKNGKGEEAFVGAVSFPVKAARTRGLLVGADPLPSKLKQREPEVFWLEQIHYLQMIVMVEFGKPKVESSLNKRK